MAARRLTDVDDGRAWLVATASTVREVGERDAGRQSPCPASSSISQRSATDQRRTIRVQADLTVARRSQLPTPERADERGRVLRSEGRDRFSTSRSPALKERSNCLGLHGPLRRWKQACADMTTAELLTPAGIEHENCSTRQQRRGAQPTLDRDAVPRPPFDDSGDPSHQSGAATGLSAGCCHGRREGRSSRQRGRGRWRHDRRRNVDHNGLQRVSRVGRRLGRRLDNGRRRRNLHTIRRYQVARRHLVESDACRSSQVPAR